MYMLFMFPKHLVFNVFGFTNGKVPLVKPGVLAATLAAAEAAAGIAAAANACSFAFNG